MCSYVVVSVNTVLSHVMSCRHVSGVFCEGLNLRTNIGRDLDHWLVSECHVLRKQLVVGARSSHVVAGSWS